MAENARRGTLLENAIAKGPTKKGECGVPRMLREHPDMADEIGELMAALPIQVNYNIAEATLKESGIRVSANTLSRHVRGRCSCR